MTKKEMIEVINKATHEQWEQMEKWSKWVENTDVVKDKENFYYYTDARNQWYTLIRLKQKLKLK